MDVCTVNVTGKRSVSRGFRCSQENATSTEPQNRTTSTEIEVQVQTTVSAVQKYIIDSPSDPEGLGYVHRRQQIQ